VIGEPRNETGIEAPGGRLKARRANNHQAPPSIGKIFSKKQGRL